MSCTSPSKYEPLEVRARVLRQPEPAREAFHDQLPRRCHREHEPCRGVGHQLADAGGESLIVERCPRPRGGLLATQWRIAQVLHAVLQFGHLETEKQEVSAEGRRAHLGRLERGSPRQARRRAPRGRGGRLRQSFDVHALARPRSPLRCPRSHRGRSVPVRRSRTPFGGSGLRDHGKRDERR